MESGHSSFRLSSSPIWGDTTMEVFSKSAQEDDEEALKWAALQKLPTYNYLTTPEGQVPEEDHEKFLYKLKHSLER